MVDVAVPAAGSGSVRLTGSGSASGREISEVRVIGDWVYFQLDGWETPVCRWRSCSGMFRIACSGGCPDGLVGLGAVPAVPGSETGSARPRPYAVLSGTSLPVREVPAGG